MNQNSTLAHSLSHLTEGWRTVAGGSERELDEARAALARSLSTGQAPHALTSATPVLLAAGSAPAVDLISIADRVATESAAAPQALAFVRDLPTSEGLARSRPAWANGMSCDRSFGAFADSVGALHWVDLITIRKTFTVVRAPAARPLCLLQIEVPLIAPAAPTVHGTLGAGSLWLVVDAFDAAAPSDAFAGLAFKHGKVTIAGAFTVSGDVITLAPNTKLTLELEPVPAPAPPSGSGAGGDFRNTLLTLPSSVTFTFAASGNALTAMAAASLTTYGSTQSFEYKKAAAVYVAPIAVLAFPSKVQPVAFDVTHSDSTIFSLQGSAPVGDAAYALPVALTTPSALGAAAAGGYLTLGLEGGLDATLVDAAAATPLNRAVLLSTPTNLIIFASTAVATLSRYDLWNGRQSRASSVEARVAEGATIIFVTAARSEFTLEDAAIAALLDRPVAATGGALPITFAHSLLAVLLTNSPPSLLIFATQAPTNALFPLALENAYLQVGQPTAFELFGRLQGNVVSHGTLALLMPLSQLVPTLPDPYLARYVGKGGGQGATAAIAVVLWTTPVSPALTFVLVQGAAAPAPALADVLTTAPSRLSRLQSSAALLDVSSNADLLGVFITETAGTLGVLGVTLVAQLDQLLLFAVPQISWEPLLTPGANWNFISPDDGTAAFMFALSPNPVGIAPARLFDDDVIVAAANDRMVGNFTLPFGIAATLDTGASGGVNPPRPTFAAMRPQFPGQQGGRQLAMTAGNVPVSDASLPGFAQVTDPYGLSVLVGGADGAGTFFNQQFDGGGKEPRIPVWRYDLSGYGASLFSNWTPAGSDPDIGISNAHFDVSVGRTIFEVVQAKSYIYPWAIPVVETVTMQRQLDGSVTRIATGWRAYKPGVFDFGLDTSSSPNVPPARIQPGAFAGLFNVRNIRSTGQTLQVNTVNGAFDYELVYFDADLQLTDTSLDPNGVTLISGQDGNGRFPGRGVQGWLQVSVGDRSRIAELEQLLAQTGPVLGPIAGVIDIGSNGTLMSLTQVDADLSDNAVLGPSIVGAVRGTPQLPRDGSWTVSRRSGNSPPTALDPLSPIPLVRPNGTTVWTMAEPSEVGATAQTFYGLLQSTGTQKSLYESPQIATGGKGYAFPQVPNFADVGALLGLRDVFPDLGSALKPPAFSGLDVSGDGLKTSVKWDIGTQPGDAALIHPGRNLLDFGPVQVYLEFTGDPTVNPPPTTGSHIELVLDPGAGASVDGRWSFKIAGLNAYVLVSGASSEFDPLLYISGDFFVSEKSKPSFSNLNVKFGSAMQVVNAILTTLADIAKSLPGGSGAGLTVTFAGSTLSIVEGFTLPTIPLGFGEIENVGMNLGSSIDLLQKQLSFQVGIGSPQAPVTWSFFPLAGNGCVVVAANQNGLGVIIQAGLGLGLTIDVAVASGSASVIFAVQINSTGSQIDIKAMLIGNAQVDVLGGLASASLTLTAALDIQPLGGGDFDLTAQVAVAIHISICWVVSVDFDGSWSMSEQLSA